MATSFLIVQRGTEIGQRINLTQQQCTIGRNPDNTIILNEALVSRYHAVLTKDINGQFSITDLGSVNGVVVNDKLLEPGIQTKLNHRDLIFIGKTVFNLQLRSEGYIAASPPNRVDPDATLFLPLQTLFD